MDESSKGHGDCSWLPKGLVPVDALDFTCPRPFYFKRGDLNLVKKQRESVSFMLDGPLGRIGI